MLFDLPGDILSSFLNVWIGVDALARLDSATCNKNFRSTLIDTFRGHQLILSNTVEVQENDTLKLLWLSLRDIKIAKMKIVLKFDLDVLLVDIFKVCLIIHHPCLTR